MKGKDKIAEKARTRGTASAAHLRASVRGKAAMHRDAVRQLPPAHTGTTGILPVAAAAPARSPAEEAAEREFREWVRGHEPVERAI